MHASSSRGTGGLLDTSPGFLCMCAELPFLLIQVCCLVAYPMPALCRWPSVRPLGTARFGEAAEWLAEQARKLSAGPCV